MRHAVPRGIFLLRVFGGGAQGNRLCRKVQGDAGLLQREPGCLRRGYVTPFGVNLAFFLIIQHFRTEIMNDDEDDEEAPAGPTNVEDTTPASPSPSAESTPVQASPASA